MRIRTVLISSFASAALCACAASSDGVSSTDANDDRPSTAQTGSGGAGGTSAAPSSTSSGDNGSFTSGAGGSSAAPNTCQYVDLLFVIDNSSSMGPYQAALAQAFPTFVDAMFSVLPKTVDLHVGITTTSFFTGSTSESTVNCHSAASETDILAHYIKPTDGSTGTNGEQGRLFSYQGKSFFATTVVSDPSALKSWFAGAAVAAGEMGSSFEMPAAGAAYAVSPANGSANKGFLRDKDGVLLIVVLSDEPDKSPEGVDTYKQMILSAKSGCGGSQCVLTAGLVDPCVQQVDDTLWKFLNAFGTKPVTGDIHTKDAAQYTNVVGDALAGIVKKTCDQIAQPK